ncbi:MAG: hypothetical protein IJ246_03645 [Clostridia bacterium]|nr:hypothetical protein [Clostridia bacterium]
MRHTVRWLAAVLTAVLLLPAVPFSARAEKSLSLIGSWAFSHAPETQVLQVSEDGLAEYQGQAYTWTQENGFLILTDDEENVLPLRYAAVDDQVLLYPWTTYHRGKTVEGQGGLIGIWEEIDGGASFVFTPAGFFLEDNSFSGNYMINEEDGTFLLHYGDVFADTLCYYSISEDDLLTVEYPWPIVPVQEQE